MSRTIEGLPFAVGYGSGITISLEVVGNLTHAFHSAEQATAFGVLTFLLGTGITYAGVGLGTAIRNRKSF